MGVGRPLGHLDFQFPVLPGVCKLSGREKLGRVPEELACKTVSQAGLGVVLSLDKVQEGKGSPREKGNGLHIWNGDKRSRRALG